MLLSVAERPGGLCQLLGQNDFLLCFLIKKPICVELYKKVAGFFLSL